MAETFQPAIDLAGDGAFGIIKSVENVMNGIAFLGDVQVLHRDQLGHRKAVVHLNQVDLLARVVDAGFLIGALGGNPRAGRSIAAANSMPSMRFAAGASLTVGASVKLGGPVAFASGGAGLSLGAGLSASASAGLSLNAGAGAGLSIGGGASAGIGISGGAIIGGSASAGISASQGAFAGLRVSSTTRSSLNIDTTQLIKHSESIGLATDSNASFRVGGQASIEGSTSLSADVGASASLRARIQFE